MDGAWLSMCQCVGENLDSTIKATNTSLWHVLTRSTAVMPDWTLQTINLTLLTASQVHSLSRAMNVASIMTIPFNELEAIRNNSEKKSWRTLFFEDE